MSPRPSNNPTKSITAERRQILLVGYLIGAAASIFPACGNIFVDPISYNFTTTEYGSLFVAQTLFAIASSLLSSAFQKRIGTAAMLRVALGCSTIAMTLLSAIVLTIDSSSLSYSVSLLATVFMGTGIGFGISVANVVAAGAWPDQPTRGVAALHTMLGCGLASAPLGLSGCVALGYWWLMPILIGAGALLLCFLLGIERDPSGPISTESIKQPIASIPKLLFLFGLLAFSYGVAESTFSNWCVIYLHEFAEVSVASAGLVLSGFWGAVMLGRFVFSSSSPSAGRTLALFSPLMMALAFVLISLINMPTVQIGGFLFAGLACAAVYPYLLGGATSLSTSRSQYVSGVMVATVLAGTGVGSYATSLLNHCFDFPLDRIYLCMSIVPLVIFFGLRTKTLSKFE